MAYVAAHPGDYEGRKVGTGQCVAFVQAAAHAPNTGAWTAGPRVLDTTPGTIAKGTIIATMVDGHYPNHAHGNHAAVYISHDAEGIQVWDQWTGQPVHRRTIRDRGNHGSASDDASRFYVVE
jgi:hypothetical protein